uniref:Acyl-[acyl-carrier-protein] hydrolase n=1 Tax=Kalanchoe fedtschenkoi TaxID=63787 RepID=A0A7N0UE39_KALFE
MGAITRQPMRDLPCWLGHARVAHEPARGGEPHNCVKINGSSATSVISRQTPLAAVTATLPLNPKVVVTDDEIPVVCWEDVRQNIPTEKQLMDQHRQGMMIEGGVAYRQTVVVRSYEVGPDKAATLESILNLLQETSLNHVWMSGLLGNGFGATHGMVKHDLIWVVSRMHEQVENYPIWGEVMEIDTFVGASGKNGMRRDWMIRSHATGQVLARATSTWVMMDQKTRRLSKMPCEARAEISPWFIEKRAIQEDSEKVAKLGSSATYAKSNLRPKRCDLDINHHVNNAKYAIPDHVLEDSQLCSIILEYRKECSSTDVVQSLCEPDDVGILEAGTKLNGSSMGSDVSLLGHQDSVRFTHLLQVEGDGKDEEILRGHTTWKKRPPSM